MRRLILALLAVLVLGGIAEAQTSACPPLCFYPAIGVPSTGGMFTGAVGLATGSSLTLYNTADQTTNWEAMRFFWTSNTFRMFPDAAGTGTQRPLWLGVFGAARWALGTSQPGEFYPLADDSYSFGLSSNLVSSIYVRRSTQGSRSKTLTDNTATAFVRLSVADDDYEGCGVIYTAYAEDTATDARQTRTGRVYAAILNNSGAETAAFSTGDSAVVVTAGTFTCTFDGNSAAADTIDLRATCDTSLAATTTLTFEYRLDCPSTVTVTPQ